MLNSITEVRFEMRFYIFLFIGLTSLSCNNNTSDNKEFIEFLGTKKSEALNKLVFSFDDFIKTNYGDVNDKNIRAFLNDFSCEDSLNSILIFETEKNKKILEDVEKTGLRKDIWLYGSETDYKEYPILELTSKTEQNDSLKVVELDIKDEFIPIRSDKSINYDSLEKAIKLRWDTTLSSNQRGAFLFGLYKYSNDTIIKDYVEAKTSVGGDISPCLISDGLLSLRTDLNNVYIKYIILTEIYYSMIKDNIKNSKT